MSEQRRIGDVLEHWADRTPDATAMVCGSRRIDYRGLHRLVDRYAKALIASGIDRGDRVAVLTTTRLEAFGLFYALCRLGASWVGLNPRHRREEMAYVVDDSRPAALIGMHRFEDRIYSPDLVDLAKRPSIRQAVAMTGDIGDFVAWDAFLARAAPVSDQDLAARQRIVDGEDAACVVYTSGSTGKPKGALLPQRGLLAVQQAMADRYPIEGFCAIVNFPMDHVGGLTDIALLGLVQGGKVVLMERHDRTRSLELMEREHVTLMFQTVGQCLDYAASIDFDDRDLSSIRCILWGGEPVPAELVERWRTVSDNQIAGYGLTESCGAMTVTPLGTDPTEIAGLIGTPLPGIEVRLIDEHDREVPRGQAGEITMSGPTRMLGYLNRPDASAAAIDENGWLRTGDLAIERPDGNLMFVGRRKDMYKTGGYSVYPREIESVLEDHPSVGLAAVVAAPHPRFGEAGCAFVSPVLDGLTEPRELEELCSERLANYKVPKRFIVRSHLPKLSSGKVDKRRLAEEILDLFTDTQEPGP